MATKSKIKTKKVNKSLMWALVVVIVLLLSLVGASMFLSRNQTVNVDNQARGCECGSNTNLKCKRNQKCSDQYCGTCVGTAGQCIRGKCSQPRTPCCGESFSDGFCATGMRCK